MSSNRFFEGLFVGGLLGFVLGLLYAPKPGHQLRREIADSSDELCKTASDRLDDIKERSSQTLQTIQTRSDSIIKNATAQVQETKEQINARIQDLSSRGNNSAAE